MERTASSGADGARIMGLDGLNGAARLLPEIEAIFFESSATQSFSSAAAREAFRERWLGRYLRMFPHEAFVALAANGSVLGYLIGCLDTAAAGDVFADVGYGRAMPAAKAESVARYPAHLHINLRADARGLGVGGRLMESFFAHCRAHGVGGVHVVTGAKSLAVGFYRKCGFSPLPAPPWPTSGSLALGREL
jgi:GNAT superfamily N-acetyltransferase